MDGRSLSTNAGGLTMFFDVFLDESLFVDLINDALSVAEEERCHVER